MINQVSILAGHKTCLLFGARTGYCLSVREPHFATTWKLYETPNDCSVSFKDVFSAIRNTRW